MPRSIRDFWEPANAGKLATRTAEDYALDRQILRKQTEIVGAMHKSGGRILAGTDVLNPFAFPGFSLHDELGLLVESGLTPMEALQAATSGPLEYFGTRASIGTIEPGRAADLVLLEANPLVDIRNTKRIAAVIAAGRLIDRSGLEEILGRAERTASLKSIGKR